MEKTVQKKYFHDRLVLLLLSVNAFLALVVTVTVLLRLDTANASGYFVQYRENLGLNAYAVGSFVSLLGFVVFAVFILGFHTLISFRTYNMRRSIALTTLGLGTLLLSLTLIVSNALLVLR